jgi:hypothetical protein
MTSRALRAAAARAGTSTGEFLEHLEQGELYCYRCQGFHPADEFGPGSRRGPGVKATSCLRSIRAGRQAELRRELGGLAAQPSGGLQDQARSSPADGQWVAVVREASPDPRGRGRASYWTGPDGGRDGRTWAASPADAARFRSMETLRDALLAAYGEPGQLPPGCRLARISQ